MYQQKEVTLIKGLLGGWLSNAEHLIANNLGIAARPGQVLKLFWFPGDGSGEGGRTDASYSWWNNGSKGGMKTDVTLGLNLSHVDFKDYDVANYYPRLVSHELLHAVKFSNPMGFMPTWFEEGLAESVHGADETVVTFIKSGAGVRDNKDLDPQNPKVINSLKNFIKNNDPGYDYDGGITQAQYAWGYLAIRYLHQKLKDNGHKEGIKDFLRMLARDAQDTIDNRGWDIGNLRKFEWFDKILKKAIGINTQEFFKEFKEKGQYLDKYGVDLRNNDTGAIGGLDADGGDIITSKNMLPRESSSWSEQPLKNFRIVWDADPYPENKTQQKFSKEAYKEAVSKLRESLPEVAPSDFRDKFDNASASISTNKSTSLSQNQITDKVVNTTDKLQGTLAQGTTNKSEDPSKAGAKNDKENFKLPENELVEDIEGTVANEKFANLSFEDLSIAKAFIAYVGKSLARENFKNFRKIDTDKYNYELLASKEAKNSDQDKDYLPVNVKINYFNENPTEFTDEAVKSLLELIYKNLFGRNIDKDGLQWWGNAAKELVDFEELEKLPFYIIDGSRGKDKSIVENKLLFLNNLEKLLDSYPDQDVKEVRIKKINADPRSVEFAINEAFGWNITEIEKIQNLQNQSEDKSLRQIEDASLNVDTSPLKIDLGLDKNNIDFF